jgi:tetratricopeptide (TPR) repeat protein
MICRGGAMAYAFTDRWGSPVFAGSRRAVDVLDEAVEDLVSLSGDPTALADEAAALDPQLVLARVLQAYLALYASSASGLERARALVGDLDAWGLDAGERELLHVLAVQSWADGEWERAASFLERALLHESRDLLALKVAQDLYFFIGNQQGLRDVVERVLDAWPSDRPGYGYVCGMYAFGLEENGQYDAAGKQARKALELNPGDVWAVHAQAHIFEMQGAQRLGVEFLDRSVEDWSSSYFATHNWWHRALYHLELREIDEALALYDGPIRGSRSSEWLDVHDAASLLWRLHLFGVDIGDRARTLLEDVEGLLDDSVSVFNDWHAVMIAGLAGARELGEQRIQLDLRAWRGTNRRVMETVGLELLEGFASFAAGDTSRALHCLIAIEPKAHVVGGSHAQRDVIDLTLIAAAAKSGDVPLAEALLATRTERKPTAKAAGLELVRVNSHW